MDLQETFFGLAHCQGSLNKTMSKGSVLMITLASAKSFWKVHCVARCLE